MSFNILVVMGSAVLDRAPSHITFTECRLHGTSEARLHKLISSSANIVEDIDIQIFNIQIKGTCVYVAFIFEYIATFIAILSRCFNWAEHVCGNMFLGINVETCRLLLQ